MPYFPRLLKAAFGRRLIKEDILKPQLLPKLPRRGSDRKPAPGTRRLLLLLAVNTLLALLLYYLVPALLPAPIPYMMPVYLALGTGFALAYVIYNRGFRTRGKTPADLPEHLTAAEREAMIADGERRWLRSRWMLTILLPIIITFLCDMILLFLIPESWLPEGLFG